MCTATPLKENEDPDPDEEMRSSKACERVALESADPRRAWVSYLWASPVSLRVGGRFGGSNPPCPLRTPEGPHSPKAPLGEAIHLGPFKPLLFRMEPQVVLRHAR